MFFSSDRYGSSLGSDRDANAFNFYIDNPSVDIYKFTLGLFEFLKSGLISVISVNIGWNLLASKRFFSECF